MDSVIYWDVFEKTGSIEAYLTYKTVDSSPKEDEENADEVINLDFELVVRNSIESVSLTG
jgi:hypothetical protein